MEWLATGHQVVLGQCLEPVNGRPLRQYGVVVIDAQSQAETKGWADEHEFSLDLAGPRRRRPATRVRQGGGPRAATPTGLTRSPCPWRGRTGPWSFPCSPCPCRSSNPC